jgi:NAD(P)H-flavin reductase
MPEDKDNNITLKLAKKIKLTSDTYIFRFSFPNPDHSFGLPIGNHVVFSA